MDPIQALTEAIQGSAEHRKAYNSWVASGGFRANVKVAPHTNTWMKGARSLQVFKVTPDYVHGTHLMSGKTFRVPVAVVEVVR